MNDRINTLMMTIATEVRTSLTLDLVKTNQCVEGLASSVGHFSSEGGKMANRILTLCQDYDSCIAGLENRIATIRATTPPPPPTQRPTFSAVEHPDNDNAPSGDTGHCVGATNAAALAVDVAHCVGATAVGDGKSVGAINVGTHSVDVKHCVDVTDVDNDTHVGATTAGDGTPHTPNSRIPPGTSDFQLPNSHLTGIGGDSIGGTGGIRVLEASHLAYQAGCTRLSMGLSSPPPPNQPPGRSPPPPPCPRLLTFDGSDQAHPGNPVDRGLDLIPTQHGP